MNKVLLFLKNKYFIVFIATFAIFQIKQAKSQTIGWFRLGFKPSYALYSVYCLNDNTVIAAGDNGYIVRTTNGGANWDSVPSGTTHSLYKISFANDSTGYAVGENGTILKTTDAGQSWTNISINTNLDLFSLSFINEDTGWVAGGKGDFLYNLMGNKGILLKTTNGGTNWVVDSTYDKTVASVFFVNNDTGYICTNNPSLSILKKTTNGGISFSSIMQDSLFPLGYYFGLHFIDAKTGFFASSTTTDYDRDGIYKTTDYGQTWTKVLSQWFIKTLAVIDKCSVYISYSDMPGDGSYGKNSCYQYTFGNTVFFRGMSFTNEYNGFGVGSNWMGNYIYKRGLIAGIKEDQISNKIELFPNPFNDKTTLSLSPDINISDISIVICNSIGQEIKNMPKITNNQILLDLTDRPKGLYYIVLKENNKIIQTKKFIKF